MNPQTRKLLIKRLIPAIEVIGKDFERFGHILLEYILRTPLEHTGENCLGFPISGVVDSSSSDGKVVAQYSAEEHYFSTGMPKAEKDIAQALQRRQNANLILLLSSQKDRPQIADDFIKERLGRPDMKGRHLKIWGAQRIAEYILDHVVFNDRAVERLSTYLPALTQIWEEAARDHLFPAPDPHHLARDMVSGEISARLNRDRVAIVGGIAGSGKSAAVKAYGAANRHKYDLLIWLDREEVRELRDLEAIPLVRGQEKRNVANLLRTRECLVVLDDVQATPDVASLVALCGPGSHILVTTRTTGSETYDMPPMDDTEARNLLNGSCQTSCPGEVFNTIWKTVGGHPLSLALMNAAVREGASWDDICRDCQEVGAFPDRNQALAERLVLRHRGMLEGPLSVFAWAGQSTCDAGFLREAIMPAGIRTLQSHALTAADRDSVLRLHDVIFSSLSSLRWWNADRQAELNEKLEVYLQRAAAANDLSLWSAAGNLRHRLEQLVKGGDRRPAYLPALLVIWTTKETLIHVLDDPIQKSAALAAAAQGIDPIEFRVLIETVEKRYFVETARDWDSGKRFLEASLAVFDNLARLPNLTAEQIAEIHHHRGKALRWLHRYDDAMAQFEAVMAGPINLHATRLQLIRLYKRKGRNTDAIQLGSEVLAAAEQTGEVSPSVLLAVMQDVPWGEGSARSKLLDPKHTFIEQTVIDYIEAGYDQAYATLAALARWWSKEKPDVLERVLRRIPALRPERANTDDLRYAFGDILLEGARVSEGDEAVSRQALALSCFESMASPESFHRQRQAELLLDMNRPAEAEQILASHRQRDTSGWIHRLMARVCLSQRKLPEALVYIDKALADPKCASRYDEFYELRYDICSASGDQDAIDDLKKAIQESREGANRRRLQSRHDMAIGKA